MENSGEGLCAKICDFGLSKSTTGSLVTSSDGSMKGTPLYLAPEVYRMQYSVASDVYAYGIMLNEMLTQDLPLPESLATQRGITPEALMHAVCDRKDRPALFDKDKGLVGDALRRLVGHCWQQDPSSRCTFAVVTAELSLILLAAVEVANHGSVKAERSQFMQSLRPTVKSPAKSAGQSTRALEDLSVEEVCALMVSVKLTPLKPLFVAREVSGMMLSFCEQPKDLMTKDFGVENEALAKGLIGMIKKWRENGVPDI